MDKNLKIFEDIVIAEQGDQYAQMFMNFVYVAKLKLFVSGASLVYSKPQPNPEVFKGFIDAKSGYSTLRIENFTAIHDEVATWCEVGLRYVWATSSSVLERVCILYD